MTCQQVGKHELQCRPLTQAPQSGQHGRVWWGLGERMGPQGQAQHHGLTSKVPAGGGWALLAGRRCSAC